MASRVRIATATWLVASGLLVGGAGSALALADPAHDDDGATGQTQDDATRPGVEREHNNTVGTEAELDGADSPEDDPPADDRRGGGEGKPRAGTRDDGRGADEQEADDPGMGNASGPATSNRAGYPDALRAAGLTQLVALAAPGLAGILVLTGAGGLVGYRQAKAGHTVRAGAVARFVS